MNNKNNNLIIFISIFLIFTGIVLRESSARQVYLKKTKSFKAEIPVTKTETDAGRPVPDSTKPIKVGILRLKTEKQSSTERSVINAALLAIDEINEQGGILNKRIEPIIVELENDFSIIAEKTTKLLTEEKVSVVFNSGNPFICETVKPIFEKYENILFCPHQCKVFEKSRNIISTGTEPTHQIIPAIKWCRDNLGKKIFLISSDTSSSKIFNLIIKNNVNDLKGEIVGEEFMPLGSDNFDDIMQKIIDAKPDVILNTLYGESNVYFFINLEAKKIKSDKIQVISFNLTQNEFKYMHPEEVIGTYLIKSYFQNINSKENNNFIRKLTEKCGESEIIDDSVEASYFGVYLWKQAVEDAETDNTKDVIQFIAGQNLNAPGGIVCINVEDQHTWKTMRIGKIEKNKQFGIVWCSDSPIKP